MHNPVLQTRLPFASWMDPRLSRLPGILPFEEEDWLRVDDAFAGQMALRDQLLSGCPKVVHGLQEAARPAAEELYAKVLAAIGRNPAYRLGETTVVRPDGIEVTLDPDQPMLTLGRLVQEDLCLMEKQGDVHVLTAAVLCFPASWTLLEKLGRPLLGIHVPVKVYDGEVAKRVQRLFDMIRPEQPLWRANAYIYTDPILHQPRREGDPRLDRTGGNYVRSERQCLLRLPRSQAVVFSIHSYVVRIETLTPEERAGLEGSRH